MLFVDDRGEPVTGEITICQSTGLDQACQDRMLSGEPLAVGPFDLLQVEGPEHGPARFRTLPEDGVVRLPRKAWLSVDATNSGELTLSLYASADTPFRRPAHRFDLPEHGGLRVPAGSWLASLSQAGAAPDLHLFEAAPASRLALDYTNRTGWSAVLSVVSADDELPVASATTVLQPSPGYGTEPPRRSRTNEAGLATFSGIGSDLVDVAVSHDELLPDRAAALSATTGSFTVRQIELQVGGHLETEVRVDGEPFANARCVLREASSDDRQPWRELHSAETDRQGACSAGPVAAGSYSLLVQLPDSDETETAPTGTLTAVWIESGETTKLAVDLERLLIEGRVEVDGEPAGGYGVRVSQMTTGSETRLENVGATTTDDEGAYVLRVWRRDEYFVAVDDPAHNFIEAIPIWVGEDGATQDFHLVEQHLEGLVVDAEGRPAEDATVGIRWNRSKLWNRVTDGEGRFRFAVNGGGTAELTPFRAGHAEGEQVTVEVPENGSVPPVVLRLGGRQGLRGTVTLRGAPAAGVRVAAYRPGGGEVPEGVGSAVTAADGGFVLPAAANVAGQPLRFFLSGPGCPLSIRDAVPDDNQTVDLACADSAGHLLLHLRDGEGKPRPGTQLTLAASRVAVPHTVLSAHLASLGLPTVTTGAGELVAAALEAGSWEVFLGQGANAATIARGEVFGFLTAAQLSAGSTVELDLTLE